jgi:uncharacterized repeat protein (TIGR01451 family)
MVRRSAAAVLAILGLTLLLLAPSAGFAKPKPKPKPLPQEQVPLWDEDAGEGICGSVSWFRQQFPGVRGTRNVASIRFKYPNGKTGTIVVPSEKYPRGGEVPGEPKGHSEVRLIKIVEELGIDPDTVEALCTELEPCELPGNFCKRQVATKFRNARVYYTHPYPYGGEDKAAEKAVRDTSVKTLKKEVAGYHKQLQATKGIMGGQGGGALQRGLARGFGGVDFSSLELRYVADTGGPRGLRYAFAGNPTAGASDQEAGLATARESSNAFFTWLALPPESFWVNLMPHQPDRIMDPQLARTEAGRILLEADLVLKKESVGWMNANTAFGKAFWDELEAIYGDRALDSCITVRTWIAPAPATVRETGDELYILDAPLTVFGESEQYPDPGTGNQGCPQEDAATEARKEELWRRTILPKLIESVNTKPEFAALRRVYLARVAAEWFRVRQGERPTSLSKVIGSGNVDPWAMPPGWSPLDVYNPYLHSIRTGEWSAERRIVVGGQEWIRTISYGGVDFSGVPRENVAKRDFKARYPRLSRRVRESQGRATADGNEVWLGGGATGSAPGVKAGAVDLTVTTPQRRVRAGQQVTYRLRADNLTGTRLHGVRVCQRMPAELAFVRSSARPRMRNGRHCWTVKRLPADRAKTIPVTARVLGNARGRIRARAWASVPRSPEVLAVTAQRSVSVGGSNADPAGGVTG